jgi:hypothetical protein
VLARLAPSSEPGIGHLSRCPIWRRRVEASVAWVEADGGARGKKEKNELTPDTIYLVFLPESSPRFRQSVHSFECRFRFGRGP